MPLAADDLADLYDRHARTLVLLFQRRIDDPEAAVGWLSGNARNLLAVEQSNARF